MKVFTRFILTATLAAAAAQAQFNFELGSAPVQIHSFGSQGFAASNQNNFLTMKTSQGSFSMTDGGANVTVKISDRFRVGAQIYDSNTGEINHWHPQLDWALADYKFKDWFGIRGGKVKTTLGLFNDTQDMEFLHNWALLPQSLYPTDLRDNTIAHLGGDIYGDIQLPKAGSLSYTAYAGKGGNNRRGGYYYNLADSGAPINSYSNYVYGGDLKWNSRVPGLMTGVSVLRRSTSIVGTSLTPYGGFPYTADSSPAETVTAVYADYSKDKLHLNAEFRNDADHLNIAVLGQPSPLDASTKGWFVSGSWKLAQKLEAGAYYSAFLVEHSSTPSDPATKHIYDRVISARYDFNRIFHVKLEGHFMDGYGDYYSAHGFYLRSNPSGFKPTTNMLLLRTGFSF